MSNWKRLETSCDTVKRNCVRMKELCDALGVNLRPHMKTHKTVEAGLLMTSNSRRRIVVSTLAEAWFFFENGFDDITYAYPLSSDKLPRCAELLNKLELFHITVDNMKIIDALGDYVLPNPSKKWSVLLMVDCGNKRDGVPYNSDEALKMVEKISSLTNAEFSGIYTHYGASYQCRGADEIKSVSSVAWGKLIDFAKRIREKGIECKDVGIGATPTCSQPPEQKHIEGITEFHPGNYVFNDVSQVNIGSCKETDIAGKVLTRVISHYPDTGHMLIDCGWLALTLDSLGKLPTGYCVFEGEPNLKLLTMTQELGKVVALDGKLDFSKYPIGSTLKILPNHACATAAMHPVYYVHDGERVTDEWRPVRGW
ncbi:uncharacterized protein LOC114531621 isoform X2 [Dendronephthya gigantea]|uniref:uncharacterized protein LOC114531621 isoform X2 n=1 Tax=Dendronephthya gigantea TaxID=151771 RepID=UPI00106B1FBB|nr:uncharacterized protein LOC114531621 isoform X2 [Dendronephthya gigantea]